MLGGVGGRGRREAGLGPAAAARHMGSWPVVVKRVGHCHSELVGVAGIAAASSRSDQTGEGEGSYRIAKLVAVRHSVAAV